MLLYANDYRRGEKKPRYVEIVRVTGGIVMTMEKNRRLKME
jgi:hypothetical protein